MKKVSLVIMFFLLLGVYPIKAHAIRENKIIRVGYVSYTKLLAKIDQNGEVQEKLEDIRASYKEKIDKLETQVNSLQEEISQNPDGDSIKEKIEEYEQKSLDLSLLKIQANRDIEKVTSTALQKLNDRIKPAIQNIAQKQHFDIILDSSLILIANPSLDITNFVLASL